MDDERMRRKLEAADGPVRPSRAFADDLYGQLTAELGLEDPDAAAAGVVHVVVAPRRRTQTGGWWVIAAAVAALVLVTTVLGAGAVSRWLSVVPQPAVLPADGVLRIAVRPDSPQAGASGTAFGGFDVDVADELGRRLGRQVRLVIRSPEQMAADAGAWDIALPSTTRLQLTSADGGGFSTRITRPYYWWPSFLVVREGSVATEDALVNASICAVKGSYGEAWGTGHFGLRTGLPDPPIQGLLVHTAPDEHSCLDMLLAGDVAAAVTATMTASDVESTPGIVRVGDGPVALEGRYVIIRDADGVNPPLGVQVEQAVEDMRADGTLSRFATKRFGGDDLSVGPTP